MSKQIPEITESSKFNFITSIWIVPIIALVIAGWLGYQHFAKRGPEIRIIFPQNEGLIAGKSVVKFRNVPIGKVTEIEAEEDMDGIEVVVRMNSMATEPYLTENAKFWIVKPEVGITGVSGLDTLLSGTYINVYSKADGKHPRKRFIGLTQPYRDSMRGEYFRLIAPSADNVSQGMPVYYKNIKIGQVEYFYLGLDHNDVEVIVFINKEYVDYVHADSKFWIKSMVNVDFTKGSLDIHIAPINFMLQGGIVFSSPGEDNNSSLEDGHVFPLYQSRAHAESTTIGSVTGDIKEFMLLTNESVARLSTRAPVRFEGFDVGWVDDVTLSYSKRSHKLSGEILLRIDTSVFEDDQESNSSGLENFYQAVEEGLRAKFTTLDPITGMLFVDLTFKHQDGNGSIIQKDKYAVLPMASHTSNSIMTSMTQILDKINNLPLEELIASVHKVVEESAKPIENANVLLEDLQTTVKNINKFTGKKSFEVLPDELNKAIKEMTRTLKSTEKVVKGYDSDSLVRQQLSQTLEVLKKTSLEMRAFLRMLNRKPNSLIFGDH